MEHFRYLYVLLRSIAVSKRPSWHAGEAPHVLTLRPTGDWGCCLAGSLSRRKVKPEQFSLQWQGNFLFVFLKCRACIFQKHISSWIHLRIFLFWCQNSEFLGWEERKKGVCVWGGGFLMEILTVWTAPAVCGIVLPVTYMASCQHDIQYTHGCWKFKLRGLLVWGKRKYAREGKRVPVLNCCWAWGTALRSSQRTAKEIKWIF